MAVANIGGTIVTQASYQRARASVANKTGNATPNSVLASIQQLNPGMSVSTNTQPFGGTGFNLGIHPAQLRKAANNPEDMARLKAQSMDAMESMTASTQRLESAGFTIYGRGTIIHADGSSSGWIMGRGGGDVDFREIRREREAELREQIEERREARRTEEARNEEQSIQGIFQQLVEDIIKEQMENAMQGQEQDENSTRNWLA